MLEYHDIAGPLLRKFREDINKSRNKRKKITQQTIAEWLGVSRSLVAKWEKGGQPFDFDQFLKWVDCLNLTANEIVKMIEKTRADHTTDAKGDANEHQ